MMPITAIRVTAIVALMCLSAWCSEPPANVYRDRITPHWIRAGARFWYRVNTGPATHEFILVDANKGTREPAFDHTRLAVALQTAGIVGASPAALALSDLDWSEDLQRLQFKAFGKQWVCDLRSYEASGQPITGDTNAADYAWAPTDGPRASRRSGPETSITFINATSQAIELQWLSPEGEAQSYGTLKTGERREQHTFSGHVWLVRTTGESSTALGVFEAQDEAVAFEITGPVRSKRPYAPRSRNRIRQREANPPARLSDRVEVREHNLFLRKEGSPDAQQLTRDGTAEDAYEARARWSPDGRQFVAMRTRKGTDRKVYLVESSPKDQVQPRLVSYDYLKPGDELSISVPHLFDAVSGCEIPIPQNLFSNAWSITDVRWKPDSSEFTFVYNQRGHQVMRVLAINATNGQPRVIIEEKSDTFIHYSGAFFCEYLDRSGEILWASERDGWNHLYLYDTQTGTLKNQVTRGPWLVRGVDRVDAEKRQIWFRAGGILPGQDPYHVHYCRVNFDGTELTVLTAGDGTHKVDWSPDRRFFVDSWSRVDQPPRHELRRGNDGTLVCPLEEAETSFLKAARPSWRMPDRFVAKGRDGRTDIHGIIHWPAHFQPTAKHAVIENIYAGPQDSHVPKEFQVRPASQDLADRGFIVVQIDGMGTANRGKKFHDVCWKNLADAGLPDRILWMKAAANQYPAMDLSRVGIYGTSAGGQNALGALLLHGDFYKAGVADCGCHDNRMDKIWWNEQWMGWPVGPHYAEQSNVTLAPRLQGKLLLLTGEVDRNVDPASTMQVANALIRAGKDFEFLVFPGVGHGTLGTPYGKRRLVDFFTRTLGPPALE